MPYMRGLGDYVDPNLSRRRRGESGSDPFVYDQPRGTTSRQGVEPRLVSGRPRREASPVYDSYRDTSSAAYASSRNASPGYAQGTFGYDDSPYGPPSRETSRQYLSAEQTRPSRLNYDPIWTPGYSSGYVRDYTRDDDSSRDYKDMLRQAEADREREIQEDYDEKRRLELSNSRSHTQYGSRRASISARSAMTSEQQLYDTKPMEYEFLRTPSGVGVGAHRRRRKSIEDLLPQPTPAFPDADSKRYPKLHKNTEGHYKVQPKDRNKVKVKDKEGREEIYDRIMELPLDYKDRHYGSPGTQKEPRGQNSKGWAREPDFSMINPGVTRAITDGEGNLYATSFHPPGRRQDYQRCPEYYRGGKMRHWFGDKPY